MDPSLSRQLRFVHLEAPPCEGGLDGGDDLREEEEEEDGTDPVELPVDLQDLPVGLGVVSHQHWGKSPSRHLRHHPRVAHHLRHLRGERDLGQ